MVKKRFKMIGDVHLLLYQDSRIFLHRRKNTGFMDGWYSVPGGHIEENETISSAASRELLEEVGVDVLPSELKLVHFMHRKQTDIRITTFWTPIVPMRQAPRNCEEDRCDHADWFSLESLPENTIAYVRFALSQVQKGSVFSEFGWE